MYNFFRFPIKSHEIWFFLKTPPGSVRGNLKYIFWVYSLTIYNCSQGKNTSYCYDLEYILFVIYMHDIMIP